MLTIAFVILFFLVFGRLLTFALKATWGLTKLVLALILLPVVLVVMVLGGLLIFALPILLIVGGIILVTTVAKKVA